MIMITRPDVKTEFEHTIRNAHLWIEACAWMDEDGIYKTQLNDALLDGVSVLGLLTEDDISDIEDAIEPAIIADFADEEASSFVPSRDAHRLGD
jgi:hypothetical protein